MNHYKKFVSCVFVSALLTVLASTAAYTQNLASPQALLNTLIAIPASSSIGLRWLVPPLNPVEAEQANLKIPEIRFSVNAKGIPWIGLDDRHLICPTTGFRAIVATPITGFVHFDNGMMLVSTVTKFGYLLAPQENASWSKLVFQPVAKLPGLYSKLFSCAQNTLYIATPKSENKTEIYRVRAGRLLAGYEKVAEIDDEVIAIAGGEGNFFVASPDAIYEVNLDSRRITKLNVTLRQPITSLALHPQKGLFVATTREVCYIVNDTVLTIIETDVPRICVRNDSLYVLFPKYLGIVALDNINSLADLFD